MVLLHAGNPPYATCYMSGSRTGMLGHMPLTDGGQTSITRKSYVKYASIRPHTATLHYGIPYSRMLHAWPTSTYVALFCSYGSASGRLIDASYGPIVYRYFRHPKLFLVYVLSYNELEDLLFRYPHPLNLADDVEKRNASLDYNLQVISSPLCIWLIPYN